MSSIWHAPSNILDLLDTIKNKYHSDRLQTSSGDCKISLALSDSKPFISGRLNWGKIKKFNNFNKIWMNKDYDYCIVLCADVWNEILSSKQKEAIIDLHLSRIKPQYEPNTVLEDGKKKVVKDDMGRIEYTSNIKLDKEGNPKWTVDPLDLQIFTSNARRYGFWCEDLDNFQKVVEENK